MRNYNQKLLQMRSFHVLRDSENKFQYPLKAKLVKYRPNLFLNSFIRINFKE